MFATACSADRRPRRSDHLGGGGGRDEGGERDEAWMRHGFRGPPWCVASQGRGPGSGYHEQLAGAEEALGSLELRQSVSDLLPHRGLGLGGQSTKHLMQRPE